MEQILQIPYGVSDFRSVRESGLYYVDKSMYIEENERQSRTLIFILPRRFGKSLFINMMRLYYDKNAAGDFDRLSESAVLLWNAYNQGDFGFPADTWYSEQQCQEAVHVPTSSLSLQKAEP